MLSLGYGGVNLLLDHQADLLLGRLLDNWLSLKSSVFCIADVVQHGRTNLSFEPRDPLLIQLCLAHAVLFDLLLNESRTHLL